MSNERENTERKKGLIRIAAGRFTAFALALVLALSFPILTSSVSAGEIDAVTTAHQTLGALATPDATILTPFAETGGEFDRSRTGTPPVILDEPTGAPRRIAAIPCVFGLTSREEVPSRTVVLPPGRGPPSIS